MAASGARADAVVRAPPAPEVGLDGAAAGAALLTGLPYVVPWLLAGAFRLAPLAFDEPAVGAPDAEMDPGAAPPLPEFFVGTALVGALLLAAGAALTWVAPAPLAALDCCVGVPGPPAAFAAASVDFVGCFGAVGFAAGVVFPPGRDVVEPLFPLPTEARPTVAFPTAADDLAELLVF